MMGSRSRESLHRNSTARRRRSPSTERDHRRSVRRSRSPATKDSRPRKRHSSYDDDDDDNGRRSRDQGHHHHSRRHRSRARETSQRTSRSPASHQEDKPQSSHHQPRSSRHTSHSRSRSPKRRRRSQSASLLRSQPVAPRKPLPSQEASYSGNPTDPPSEPPLEKQKPNYKPTGLLAAETNKITIGSGTTSQSIILKYHEPSESRKPAPSSAWILYIFRGSSPDPLQTILLHTRSCWLLGRESAVADILVEHPSCSKQHAVFQFRYVVKKDEWGEKKGKVRLYLLDLESANGTKLNGERVEAARYVELRSGDVVGFGESEREYVVLLPPKEGERKD